MKKKTLRKKLGLNKETIANLDQSQMIGAKGGDGTSDCFTVECYDGHTQLTCGEQTCACV